VKKSNNYVAIMAGGIGSRFWPVSRSTYPKQFLDILNTGQSLLQSTFKRFNEFIPAENIYIVTSASYNEIVQEQLPQLPVQNILGEPVMRNTAPCIAYISVKIRELDPDANLIVAPSDHLILDDEAFKNNCLSALSLTEKQNVLVTMGIKPVYANTGYGYIQFDDNNTNGDAFKVKRFTEKPDAPTARQFFESGEYLWNSGIFIWKVKDILSSFQQYAPGIYSLFSGIANKMNTPEEDSAIIETFPKAESISIDYAIMEKADNVFVIPAKYDWNDLGTWNSAWENFNRDEKENAVNSENAYVFDSSGCLVYSKQKKLVVLGGVDNLIVVDTPDALLVCSKDNEQEIKGYVNEIKKNTGEKYT
jgi:mannose-1-phosphate guanylyltransferase